MKEKLVLIGNGMAGVRTLEELFKHSDGESKGSDLYDVTVIGAEPHPNYNRIMLSPVLASEKTIDDIILNSLDWYDENGIELITGDAVTEMAIDESAADWHGLARNVRLRKFGAGEPADFKAKAKQMRFLQYRGFEQDHIQSAF